MQAPRCIHKYSLYAIAVVCCCWFPLNVRLYNIYVHLLVYNSLFVYATSMLGNSLPAFNKQLYGCMRANSDVLQEKNVHGICLYWESGMFWMKMMHCVGNENFIIWRCFEVNEFGRVFGVFGRAKMRIFEIMGLQGLATHNTLLFFYDWIYFEVSKYFLITVKAKIPRADLC